MALLTYEQILNGDHKGGYATFGEGFTKKHPNDVYETLQHYGLEPYHQKANLSSMMGVQPATKDLRQELLNRMRAQQPAPAQDPYTGGGQGLLAGQPDNEAPMPVDAQGNPSWGPGPQTQELPQQSPFGQAWGGGQGTTYNPITMNQQAQLLSYNQQAPAGWMNGLLQDSPWASYYGVQGSNGLG